MWFDKLRRQRGATTLSEELRAAYAEQVALAREWAKREMSLVTSSATSVELVADRCLQVLPELLGNFFVRGVDLCVGQGAFGVAIRERVGHAFLSRRNVFAMEN